MSKAHVEVSEWDHVVVNGNCDFAQKSFFGELEGSEGEVERSNLSWSVDFEQKFDTFAVENLSNWFEANWDQ